MALAQRSSAFSGTKASSRSTVRPSSARSSVKTQAIFSKSKAAPKTKEAYVCLDCGYLYDGATPFAELKVYACPVCGAPKRRFKPLQGASRGNDPKSMVARKEKLRAQIEAEGGDPDESSNELLIATGALIAAALGFLAYTNLA